MIYSAPQLSQGGPSRVLVLNDWFKIEIQVTGAGTVYLGTSKDEAGKLEIAGIPDGLQFNNTNALRPYSMWWKGELWASSPDPGTFFTIIVPGITAERSPLNKCIQSDEMTAEYSSVD